MSSFWFAQTRSCFWWHKLRVLILTRQISLEMRTKPGGESCAYLIWMAWHYGILMKNECIVFRDAFFPLKAVAVAAIKDITCILRTRFVRFLTRNLHILFPYSHTLLIIAPHTKIVPRTTTLSIGWMNVKIMNFNATFWLSRCYSSLLSCISSVGSIHWTQLQHSLRGASAIYTPVAVFSQSNQFGNLREHTQVSIKKLRWGPACKRAFL